MTYFAKFAGRTWQFLGNGTRRVRPDPRSVARIQGRSFTRNCTQLETENPFRSYLKGQGSPKGNHDFWLLAGGIFMSLFKWGEEEEEKTPELIMSIKRSIWLIQKEEYKKAEQLLHVALRQAQGLQNYDGITYVYDIMANLAFEVEDYKKAEVLFVSVMQRLIANGTPQDDIKIIHISLKMAKLYQQTGDLSKAEDGYEFCLKSLEGQVEKDPENEDILVLWAMTLDWYARMLLNQSKFARALKNMEAAYGLCLRIHGREHEQTVVLLNDLGTINCLLGEHDRAINYLTDAAEIGKKLPEMVELGSIHVNLGSVYLKKGLYDEAKKSCEKGRAIAKKRNNEDCIEEADNCLDTVKQFLNSYNEKK